MLFGALRRLLGCRARGRSCSCRRSCFLLLEGAFVGVAWRFLKPWASERLAAGELAAGRAGDWGILAGGGAWRWCWAGFWRCFWRRC